ncbi:TVG1201040 [Thermoplasma volcanium GSS1]|uniref:TVG1201040 protein n=1 Tax=Thermoplasma volcanium (strain ATCC 51530 / DSM 4299 / JCM 9571 / NBRC 15438 / GSS1) TaxID=273116 RepID=Q979I9_THEVO|nr:amylo-alpha-1,6-glucosidase [Thermoplasma volcanium]BAB60314.1 TVG1201040 [Thermoplasma volcanium GSS1]
MIVPEMSRKKIELCRELDESSNHKDILHWVVVPKNNLDTYRYSMVKGQKSHFITYLNGNIARSDLHRSRTGFWFDNICYVASMEWIVGNVSLSDSLSKYVRGLGYIYRSYDSIERLDYIAKNGALHIDVLNPNKSKITLNLLITHSVAWPSNKSASHINISEKSGLISLESDVAKTFINLACDGSYSIKFSENNLIFNIEDSKEISFVFSPFEEKDSSSLDDVILDHMQVLSLADLETPDFKLNKIFFWAKNDLFEFYSETSTGNGWFAGFPIFSWYFGRDGLWMGLAANTVGMSHLTREHMRTLLIYSKDGRIPHEIGLSNDGMQSYSISDRIFNTMYMSIDSSLLWLLSNKSLENWESKGFEHDNVTRVFKFASSCDSDGDGLLENNFSDGLIGWPETWANIRNGKAVDINALWVKTVELYSNELNIANAEELKKKYLESFFSNVSFTDFIDNSGYAKSVKSAMQFVPGIFFTNNNIVETIKQLAEGNLTPWGVRSVSVDDPMFDGGYHTGTVWPLMTGWFVLSAYKNGLKDIAFKQLMTFSELAFSSPDLGRINETYDSMIANPTGQFAQGWSSSMLVLSVMQGLLGIDSIEFDPSSFKANGHHNLPEKWKKVKISKLPWRGKLYNICIDSVEGVSVTEV